MEIGSFIELEFRKGHEYYTGNNVARLNSGRAGIYNAVRILGCDTVYLPYYQCKTVQEFLNKKKLRVEYYGIDSEFNPTLTSSRGNAAIVLVNYFGMMSNNRMSELAEKYENVIIDNSQAFFAKPIEECMNVYSARKFIGVPDGAYVIGNNATKHIDEYDQDYSSDTSSFLLQRIEYGCEGKTYEARMVNEHRIDAADIKKMSKLTHAILDGTNYDFIVNKRKENYETACHLFDGINMLNARMCYDNDCVPMVYPLVVENDGILPKLLENKIFQGHWWSYLLNEVKRDSFEYWLSRYIIPITIDQRYGKEELKLTFKNIKDFLDGE